jgi:D-lactate dehydrogenase
LNKPAILSLHLPLTKESKHIINSDSISEMKEGVFLINISRGGLIEKNALIKGLKSVKTGAEGLDFYEEEEEGFFYRPFIRFDN